MLKWFFKLIFKLRGWTLDSNLPEYGKRAVCIAAPHTSNWDFLFMIAGFDFLNIPVRFTIKKEWLKWPFKPAMIKFGAVGIDRRPKVPGEKRPSMVEIMINLFKEHEHLILTVTPEGTRKKRTKWKTGFYHVAKAAGVPIMCGYLDYKEKIAGVGMILHPGDDMEADMKKITAFYMTKHPKNPELYSVDLDYA
ncbi:MAG: acyltransferase [Bacteroidetes bacterium]|nr:acyltransferase [Bacteroidota bacterium]